MIKCAVRHIQLILRGASDPALQQELNEIDVCSTSDAVSTIFANIIIVFLGEKISCLSKDPIVTCSGISYIKLLHLHVCQLCD